MDAFTQKRLFKFIDDHRQKSAQLPTMKDLNAAGFEKADINRAVKAKKIAELYVTLTTGAVVCVYKVATP